MARNGNARRVAVRSIAWLDGWWAIIPRHVSAGVLQSIPRTVDKQPNR
jgi:hypothetical protein